MAEETPWEATLEDMHSMAGELAADGWETVTIVAGDTTPVSPAVGPDDRFGIVHVVEGDDADRLESLVPPNDFTSSEAYVAVAGGVEYAVTVVRDPDARVAVLLAGAFEYATAGDCFAAAAEEGRIYTHVQRLDGTRAAVFEHDDPGLFDPE
ncbi:hypothetical protein D8Y22_16280 [Salinadaptatus halalkaliphilus]|uniref:Uncharacterized protein n=1 Tax=Salinadaptatus halalkaliphilus TaxID=2419781 RepID=A0A4S3TJY6_9EURY|nr:hypothetical protein [Salinadaptatus halalkaliphilus]THE63880.1 hypothetical protein D8Y22_16280 [Salinadaptatus halalkaliphilus]